MRRVWDLRKAGSRPVSWASARGCEYAHLHRGHRGARAGSACLRGRFRSHDAALRHKLRVLRACIGRRAAPEAGHRHHHKAEGVEKDEAQWPKEVALLVKKYRGSLSGEHGDGRARAPYHRTWYSQRNDAAARRSEAPSGILKNRFNPGKIVQAKPIDFAAAASASAALYPEAETVFRWQKEGRHSRRRYSCVQRRGRFAANAPKAVRHHVPELHGNAR